jgi:hypothetical protein
MSALGAVLGAYELPIREADLWRWDHVVFDAKRAVREDVASGKDEGTSVLGAGVAVWILKPRARNPVRRILIEAPFQGNVGSFRASQRAIQLLKTAGLAVHWYDGVMD